MDPLVERAQNVLHSRLFRILQVQAFNEKCGDELSGCAERNWVIEQLSQLLNRRGKVTAMGVDRSSTVTRFGVGASPLFRPRHT
jgi:hypothetical protein